MKHENNVNVEWSSRNLPVTIFGWTSSLQNNKVIIRVIRQTDVDKLLCEREDLSIEQYINAPYAWLFTMWNQSQSGRWIY